MKLFAGLAAIAALAAAVLAPEPQTEPWTVIIGGDTQGYLSPCGCVKPMSGGIRRRFTLVKTLKSGDRTLVLENGGFSRGNDRQSELQMETLAEALKAANVDAVNLNPNDLSFGPGVLAAAHRLTGEKVVATPDLQIAGLTLPASVVKGPFYVAALPGQNPARETFALARAVDEAKLLEKTPILLLSGDQSRAKALADEFPDLRLIVYRQPGNAPAEPFRHKDTLLVTPGEKGKHVLRLLWNGRLFEAYEVFSLGPEVADDQATAAIYRRYLDRVGQEKLLEQIPRTETTPYAGSQACQSCHAETFETWKTSEHAAALHTLEAEHHDRDPECVGCHVVGLNSTKGFRDRKTTPTLSDVGCESCHGSGVLHVMESTKHRMPKIGPESCLPCHNLDHSPGFDYETYWEKIRH